ncbi:MAG: hypothetical protein K8R87_04230 [Verrucomicrobia bacterium]|nr:hypothetical protein [Verrucomicrobiota bacterium]
MLLSLERRNDLSVAAEFIDFFKAAANPAKHGQSKNLSIIALGGAPTE